MLVGTVASPPSSSSTTTTTKTLPNTQVCFRLSSPHKFKILFRNSTAASHPHPSPNYRLSRAGFPSQNLAFNRRFSVQTCEAQKSFYTAALVHGLCSGSLIQHGSSLYGLPLQDFHSYSHILGQHGHSLMNGTQRQQLNRPFHRQAALARTTELGAKTTALALCTTLGQYFSSATSQQVKSTHFTRADSRSYNAENHPASIAEQDADSRPLDVDRKLPQTIAINRGKNTHSSKRRRSRSSAKSFDVLDELVYSQNRSSSAILEKLQSAMLSEKDDEGLPERKRGAVRSGFRAADTWEPVLKKTTESAQISGTSESSIKKALSPTSTTLSRSQSLGSLQQAFPDSRSRAPTEEASDTAEPSLRGQEVLWALQKAAMEKAKLKPKPRKVSQRVPKSKEVSGSQNLGDWRNAKPIVLKPEWALQLDELERRIEDLKKPIQSS